VLTIKVYPRKAVANLRKMQRGPGKEVLDSKNAVSSTRKGGVDEIMVVFGIRELLSPRGERYFYYKLDPSGREFFLDYLDLYKTSEEDLRALFRRAAQKVHHDLNPDGCADKVLTKLYKTENISAWAKRLLGEVLESYDGK
jgi:hypothetical protein